MRSSWGWASILAITSAWTTIGQAQDVGHCVAKGAVCSEKIACVKEGALCFEGSCLELGKECKDSNECDRGPCVAMYGSCTSETDCNKGDPCGPAGSCMALLGEPPPPPDGDGGTDMGPPPCRDEADCRPGDRCEMGFCLPPRECESDADCKEGGQCEKEIGLCIPPGGPECGGDPACEQMGPPTDCGPEPCPGPTGGDLGGAGGTGGEAVDDAKDQLDDAKAEAENKELAALCSVKRVGAGQAGLSAAMLLFSVSTLLSRRSRRRK